jgi:SpoIID/LytB domain protein
MRSRRVIVRLAPYVMTFGLLGSTLAWHNVMTQKMDEDLGTPRVVVDQLAVPTVRTDVPVEPAPAPSGAARSAAGQGGAEVEADGSSPEPSAQAPVAIAELTPREVDPFALVGVTWASGVPAAAEVSVRWRGKQGWSDWTELDQENSTPEEGRPGTEPQWVKWADAVAVRVVSPVRAVPNDLRIATVDPGDVRGITPAAVGQPGIILRSAWHARSQGDCSSPRYGSSTQAAVIHHTVGSNSYSKSESPGIVRSIQAYHMEANNWCDIGYNFLVDRYGQIFEGRGGGIARPVRAAHSGNAKVNELTVGVSLMGTFTNTAPTAAMKSAAARLVAWRFSIGHVPAKGTVSIGGETLNRIAGHRDVVGTACPGQYAYAWLGASGGLRDTVARIIANGGTPTPTISGFHGVVRSQSVIDYGWNAVKGAAKYQLVVSRSSKWRSKGLVRAVPGTRTRVAGLGAGTTYYAKVRALRSNGTALTNFSITLHRTTSPPPGTAGIPKKLRLAGRSASHLTFAWNATRGAATYQIRLSRSASMTSSSAQRVTTTVARFKGLSANTRYYAQVRAFNRHGSLLGAWSARLSARTSSERTTTANRAVAVPSSGTYTFRGHGFGHGIGMGQYGAAGAARSGKTYWPILNHYYPGTAQATMSGKIRVLISADTTRNVKILGRSGIQFRIGSGSAVTLPTTIEGGTVERWSIEQEGGSASSLQYRIDGDWHALKTWTGSAGRFEAPTLSLVFPDETVRTYRTSLVAAHPETGSSGRDTVNELSLEDYTAGVVPREMSYTWPAEALKAQAVAARTYGARAIRSSSYYDICDTTACQVYGGATSEKSSTNAAVTATAGKILTYEGLPAYTQFSASTGGYTDQGTKPYLRAASDPWDDWSGNPRHSWSVPVSAATIAAKYSSIGTLKALEVTSRNGYGEWGGRVTGLKLIGSAGSKTITGNDARWAFGLRSNWFMFG